MESQALVIVKPDFQPQAQVQTVPAVTDTSEPMKSANEEPNNSIPKIIKIINPLRRCEYPIGAISLPFILLINTYLLFFPHSTSFNSFLESLFVWFLWLSFVLAICGNLRVIWIFFTSGLQGITSVSDFITCGCAFISGEFLIFVLLMTLVLYVLPAEVLYLGLWGFYFVAFVRAFRMPTGGFQKGGDVEGGEAGEEKDKSKQRHLRLTREYGICIWASLFFMWNSIILLCMLRFSDATPDEAPTSEWRLRPPFNIQIPVPESVNNVLQGLMEWSLILSVLGVFWANIRRMNMFLCGDNENEVGEPEMRTRIFLTRAICVCSGLVLVASIGMVWGVWLMGPGGV